jgi:acyl-coenzyme A thioesterase PaaI-like protein
LGYTDATAVTPRQGGSGIYDGEVHRGWDIGGNANGGYLLAIAGRAMAHAAGRPDPITITAHYLSPGRPGPLEVRTEVVKAGKRFATVRATMVDGDAKPIITVVGTFGDLDPAKADDWPTLVQAEPPDLPPIEVCQRMARAAVPGDAEAPPDFVSSIQMHVHPDDAGFATGRKSGEMRVRGWFNLPDHEPVGTIGLLTVVDAFPPTVFNTDLPVAWVPTVELTAHIRARPRPGWLRCAFTTRFVTGGFIEEDGEVWDEAGTLVAQSRQLALLPRT